MRPRSRLPGSRSATPSLRAGGAVGSTAECGAQAGPRRGGRPPGPQRMTETTRLASRWSSHSSLVSCGPHGRPPAGWPERSPRPAAPPPRPRLRMVRLKRCLSSPFRRCECQGCIDLFLLTCSSPRDHGRSPRDHRRSPRDRPSSPGDHGRSPGDRPSSPRDHRRSPRDRPSSPRDHGRSPRDRPSSPRDHGRSPGDRPSSPRDHRRSPRDRPSSPGDHRRSPGDRSRSSLPRRSSSLALRRSTLLRPL